MIFFKQYHTWKTFPLIYGFVLPFVILIQKLLNLNVIYITWTGDKISCRSVTKIRMNDVGYTISLLFSKVCINSACYGLISRISTHTVPLNFSHNFLQMPSLSLNHTFSLKICLTHLQIKSRHYVHKLVVMVCIRISKSSKDICRKNVREFFGIEYLYKIC